MDPAVGNVWWYKDPSFLLAHTSIMAKCYVTRHVRCAVERFIVRSPHQAGDDNIYDTGLCFMQPSMWYSCLDVPYWAERQMDSIMLGCTSRAPLFTAFLHTSAHITVIGSSSGSLGFAVKRWPFTPSLCTLCSAQMVSMRFIWQPAPSRAHSGL